MTEQLPTKTKVPRRKAKSVRESAFGFLGTSHVGYFDENIPTKSRARRSKKKWVISWRSS